MVKLEFLAAAGAALLGVACAIIANPAAGAAMGIIVFAGAQQDINRRRRRVSSAPTDKE